MFDAFQIYDEVLDIIPLNIDSIIQQQKLTINVRLMNKDMRQGLQEGHQIQQFPIKQQERVCTDVFCTIIGIAYTLILIIIALIVFNGDHYTRTSFPSDSQGRVCGYDLKNHPYIYFTNFPSIKDRVCVQSCPKDGDKRLNCYPTDNIGCSFSNNPNFTVTYYPSATQILQIGSFCVPASDSAKQKLYEDINVTDRYAFFQQIQSILICALISLGLAIIYLIFVQWLPKLMNVLSVVLGLVFLCIMVLFLIFYPTANIGFRIFFAVVILLLLAIVALGAFKSKPCFEMHGVFLYYATKFLKENLIILVYIPIFIAAFILFILIVIWELKSLWSSSSVIFTQEEVYYQFKNGSTTFSTIAVVFQFLWGLSFLKESFNYCISGNAVYWYDKQSEQKKITCRLFRPLYNLFRFNFGGIVAGSFINLLFSLFDYIFDVLRADTANQGERHSCLQALDAFFDLVRSDAMAYINVAGNPYCNASRYCQALCQNSPIAESYRICSHFLLAGIVATISFFLQGKQVSIFIVLIVFLISLFISTFFISLHADAAEAIQIIFLLDYEFAKQGEKRKDKHAIPHLKFRNQEIAEEYHKQSELMKARIKEAMKDELK